MEQKAEQAEPVVSESATVAAEDLFDISIVSDISDDNDTVSAQEPAKKRGRNFANLKFGDDYNIENDGDTTDVADSE